MLKQELDKARADVARGAPLSHVRSRMLLTEIDRLQAAFDEAIAEIVRQAEVIGWVDAWVSNPVGAYSVAALDGMFAMTRDKIAALSKGERS